MEIERKFRVETPPDDLDRHPASEIEQGYLAIGADGSEVRLRRRAGHGCFLTVKRGEGLVRGEFEVELDPAQFAQLWPATEGRRLEKTRFLVPVEGERRGGGGVTIEVDVYAGSLAGLVVAEVEFGDAAAAQAFAPPDWFGPEVTEDPAYKNRSLAVTGTPGDAGI